MTIYFNKDLCRDSREQRILANQFQQVKDLRLASHEDHKRLLEVTNAETTPKEAYKDFDPNTTVENIKRGEFALLSRVMGTSKSVDLGTELFEYRRSGEMGKAKTSMSGQKGVVLDSTGYNYAATPVPIHDIGYGRGFREMMSLRKDGFDALVDDAREADKTLMRHLNNYMWNGDSEVTVKGKSWLGIKSDPSVATASLGVDLALDTTSATDIRNEVRRVRDILIITNKCQGELSLSVSPEIASNWERVFSTSEGIFGTIGDMIVSLRGIAEIVEDSELSGNQIAMTHLDTTSGFHAVTGMAISSYALKRDQHNDDFAYIKWCAMGFMARNTHSGKTCALYGS